MRKHRPVRWKVGEPRKSFASGEMMYGIEGASTISDYEDWGFNEHDARLIAAAPELLEALKNLLEACLAADVHGELSHRIDGGLMDAANQVIAKATGQEQ